MSGTEVDDTLYEQWVSRRALSAADRRRIQAEADDRRRADPAEAAIAKLRELSASHRSTAAFYARMAKDEAEAQPRRAHIENAEHFMRLAQEAEARIARATPPVRQRALVVPAAGEG